MNLSGYEGSIWMCCERRGVHGAEFIRTTQVSTVDSVCVREDAGPSLQLQAFCASMIGTVSIPPGNQRVPGQIPNALLDINLTIESRVQQRKFKEAQKRVDKMIMLTCI